MNGRGLVAKKSRVFGFDELAMRLNRVGEAAKPAARKAVAAGAGVLADSIRASMEALPTDSFRYLHGNDKLAVASETQKRGMINAFGITPMKEDGGTIEVRIGFDGGEPKGYITGTESERYPKGLPAAMVAASINSGSSARQKRPFFRSAINSAKPRAQKEMERAFDEELQKIEKG